MKLRKRGFKYLTITTGVFALLTTNVYALPYASANISGLTSKVDTADVGTLIGDHLEKKTVYVQPGSKKFNGKFYLTNGGIDCQDLFNLRKLTYRMPTEEEFSSVVQNNQTYSPAFEATVGVTAKNMYLGKKIVDAKFKVLNFIEDHKEEYGIYSSAKAQLDLATSEANSIKEEIKDLNSNLVNKIALATTEIEKENIRELHRSALRVLVRRQSSVDRKKSLAAKSFHQALIAWAPYKDQLEWLTNIERNLEQSFQRIQELAEQSLNRSENLVKLLEKKTVGYASSSYSLNVEPEISLLNSRMKEAGINDYSISPLRVFNVRLNPGVTKKVNKMKDSDLGVDYELISYHFPLNTRLLVNSAEKFVTIPVDHESEDGSTEQLRFLMTDLDGSFGGSQSFEIPVTQGSICGYAKSKQHHYNYTDSNGNSMSRTVNHTVYESPAPNQPVFVQNVALRYNFYEKSDPIHGKCRLNVNKTSSYVRNAGRRSSWRWFKKSTHTWDDTKKNMSEQRGIACSLTKSPQGSSPQESKELNSAFEKALYQDMFGLFLSSYAKDWEVTPLKPEVLSADSRFFSKIGSGVMNLCGSNMYCQIGGIVLKSMDELVGTRHSGSTSNTTKITGTLTKDFSLNTYMVSEGFSNIEMRVCLDHTQCED